MRSAVVERLFAICREQLEMMRKRLFNIPCKPVPCTFYEIIKIMLVTL